MGNTSTREGKVSRHGSDADGFAGSVDESFAEANTQAIHLMAIVAGVEIRS